jgi:antitoxin (DNA-binding transcriptional repressor) of toxin-antitoxin stability system
MKTIDIAQANDSLSEYAKHAEDLPLVITHHGEPVAALLAVPNADLETVSLSTNPKFVALMERSRQRHASQGGISSEEMRRRFGLAQNREIEHDE